MQAKSYPEIDPAFGHWLAGFIDGEGCFYITRNPSRGSYCPRFALRLRDDDAGIINEIHRHTNIGCVCNIKAGNHGGRPTRNWQIQSGEDCRALIRIIEAHPLRSKKGRDYVVWREAVEWWTGRTGGSRWAPTDWTPMREFKTSLEQGRAYPSVEEVEVDSVANANDLPGGEGVAAA